MSAIGCWRWSRAWVLDRTEFSARIASEPAAQLIDDLADEPGVYGSLRARHDNTARRYAEKIDATTGFEQTLPANRLVCAHRSINDERQ